MNKILFLDAETTGLNSLTNGMHQIAGIIVINGVVKEEFNFQFKPMGIERVEADALAVSNLTIDEVMARTITSEETYYKVDKLLCKHVNKFDKKDKFVFAGYNCPFDVGFMNDWYLKNGNKYFFGLCHGGAYLDGLNLALLAELKAKKRLFNPDRKLGTVAKTLGVNLDNAHDALADIRATREVIKKLWGMVTTSE